MSAGDGRTRWRYQAGGAVKGGPALADGMLYFGDYGGQRPRRPGARRQAGVVGRHAAAPLRLRLGQLLLDAGGRVRARLPRQHRRARLLVLGGQRQACVGKGTGAYVYASPAVASTPGLGPTVYIGSYDGRFYAFDARSGAVRWKRGAGGKISGGGDDRRQRRLLLRPRHDERTIGLDARTGKQGVRASRDGAFNPVVADGARSTSPATRDTLSSCSPPQDARSAAPQARSEAARSASAAARRRRTTLRRSRAARAARECRSAARSAVSRSTAADRVTRIGAERTGTPAAARCALTSATVWWP